MIYLLLLTRPAVCSVVVEVLYSTGQRCGAVSATPACSHWVQKATIKWLDVP